MKSDDGRQGACRASRSKSLDAQTARQLGLPASTKGVVVTDVDPASRGRIRA